MTHSRTLSATGMPMRLVRWTAATLWACAATGAIAQASPTEPIRVGALLSVTGGLAAVGLPEREGVLLAQKVVNARGGVNGRPLEIVVEDDG